jgi:hypothetical protein
MSADSSNQQQSSAYQTGYRDGYSGSPARPENFHGQESEYMRGHSKGWYDGQGQPRTTI